MANYDNYDNGNDDYKNWLQETFLEDTKENRGWYNCPEEDRADYINDHRDWWNNL